MRSASWGRRRMGDGLLERAYWASYIEVGRCAFGRLARSKGAKRWSFRRISQVIFLFLGLGEVRKGERAAFFDSGAPRGMPPYGGEEESASAGGGVECVHAGLN